MKESDDFVRQYDDESKDSGFQFVFKCDSCGRETRSAFDQFNYGTISDIADKVGDFLGGVVEGIADVGQGIEKQAYDSEHAKALEKAVKTAKDQFVKCPTCALWVCKSNCWDTKSSRHKTCGTTAQPVDVSSERSCPICGHVPDPGDTFCSNCGADLSVPKFCSECGKEIEFGDKFCPGCGHELPK